MDLMPFVVLNWVGRVMGDVLDWVELGSFGDKCGASHCNQWGLYGVVIFCREG